MTVKKDQKNEVTETTNNENQEPVTNQENENESESTDNEDETNDEESEEEESETSEENEDKGDRKPKRNSFKKRLDRMRRRESEARREADYWRQQAHINNQKQPEKETVKKDSSKPRSEDYDSNDDFIEALTDWKTKQAIDDYDKNMSKKSNEKRQIEVARNWQSKVNEFKVNHPDFDEIMEDVSDISIADPIRDAILEAGPEVLYELAKDPDEASRIASLSPYSAIREIGKIEARLSKKTKKTTTTKTTTTKAPPPMEPVKGGGSKGISNIYDPNISQAEYEKLRIKQRREKAGYY